MLQKRVIQFGILFSALAGSLQAQTSGTWVSSGGVGQDNNLNNGTNWNSSPTVPNEIATFNGTDNVHNPEATADFNITQLAFSNFSVQYFFTFTNCSLIFTPTGTDIVGVNVSSGPAPVINLTNDTNITSQLSLNASVAFQNNTLGTSQITATNTGTLDNQIQCGGNKLIINFGLMEADNTGGSTGGTGANSGYVSASQIEIDTDFNAIQLSTITLNNTGTAGGSGSSNSIGYVGGDQLLVKGDLLTQSYNNQSATFTATNSGTNSGTNGKSKVGYVGQSQMEFDKTFSANTSFTPDTGTTIRLVNTGTNSSTTGSNEVGYINTDQLLVKGAFGSSLPNSLILTATNSGSDTGYGGNLVGDIATGNQMEFNSTFTIGTTGTITLGNSGTSATTDQPSSVGYIGGNQLIVNDVFSAGASLNLSAGNTGDNSSGATGNKAGYIAGNQIECDQDFTVTTGNVITLNNNGINTSGDNNSVGFVGNDQFFVNGVFSAGNGLVLSATNSGENTGSNNFVGVIAPNGTPGTGNQMEFDKTFTVTDLATITLGNSGTNFGGDSSQVGIINCNQMWVKEALSAGNNLTLSAGNIGLQSGTSSNNLVGFIGNNQLEFDDAFSYGNNAKISLTNTGGTTGGATGGAIGLVLNNQLLVMGSFSPSSVNAHNLTLTAKNSGNNYGTGNDNRMALVDGNQVEYDQDFTVNNGAMISLNNSGLNSSSDNNSVGTISNDQFLVKGAFSAGNSLTLSAGNSGGNTGSTNTVGVLGVLATSGNQMEFQSTFTVLDSAMITLVNNGMNFNGASSSVGFIRNNQMWVKGAFSAGNSLTLSAGNSGTQSALAGSANFVGYVTNQMEFDTGFTYGNSGTISLTNFGGNTGAATNNLVGYLANDQLLVKGAFAPVLGAGNDLDLSATNTGSDTGTGGGYVGYVNGNQMEFQSTFAAGNNATITLGNSGSSAITGGATAAAIGVVNGDQLLVSGAFNALSGLTMSASNTGVDSSSSTVSGNSAGYVGDNQMGFQSDFTVTDNATITLNNEGTNSRTVATPSDNLIGLVNAAQFMVTGDFMSGNALSLSATNRGMNGTGASDMNATGLIGSSQTSFGSFTTGNNATISLTNSGINTDTTNSGNLVGVVANNQFVSTGPFKAGQNLNLSATNTSMNSSPLNPFVGFVEGDQIQFGDTFTAGDGALVQANNSGTVVGSQIHFVNGFNLSGTATFMAANDPTITTQPMGIYVEGTDSFGDVNIILQNANLFSKVDLGIGQLNGDMKSNASCDGTFTIDTDPNVIGDFEGSITSVASLIKTGLGTQILSGTNTFTNDTTLAEGTLDLTGSLAGNVNILPPGTLEGTGTALGTVTNQGTISPGEGTINTLTVGNLVNNGGTYVVDINSAGEADLINVLGTAQINGGTVVLNAVDLLIPQKQYTIITAAGGRMGTFNNLTTNLLLSPFLDYDSHNVFLTYTLNISKAARTRNQCLVACQLDSITHPNACQISLLNQFVPLPLGQATIGLDSLTGQQYTNDVQVAQDVNRLFIRRLYDPIRALVTTECNCCARPGLNAWFEAGGRYASLAGDANGHGYKLKGYEITAGVQNQLPNHLTCGLAGSYEEDTLTYKEHGGKGKSNSWLVGLYGLYRPACFYTFADLAFGHSSNTMNRNLFIGKNYYQIHSKPQLSQFTFYGEFGFDYGIKSVLVQPFVGIEAGAYHKNGLREQGCTGWELILSKKQRAESAVRAGLHLTAKKLPFGAIASIDLGYNRRLTCQDNTQTQRFVQFGTPFTIDGVVIDANSFDWAMTISKCVGNSFRIYLEGSGETGNRANTYNGQVGFQYTW